MIKYFKFFSSLLLTISLIFVLNTSFEPAPAMGKFLNPFDGCWQNAESVLDFSDKEISIPGNLLKSPANVTFDKFLVPHIFAQNNEDLYFLQGYITAKFRLWQMEIQTASAAGRVSEIAGEKALEKDRLNRRIGLQYGAEKSLETINKDSTSKKLIDAYCAGVNAYINSLQKKDYPLEYKLLGYAPEKWTPLKVAILLKYMANMLSSYEFDIENTNFTAKYGEEAFNYLFPEKDDFKDFIIPKNIGNNAGSASNTKSSLTDSSQAFHFSPNFNSHPAFFDGLKTPNDMMNGSNNWAVGGSKTKSGKPLLCNDPHLQLNLPSIWFEVHLVSPTMNVYGASLPGAPCVISGFNENIAWGVTNGGRDVRDWFATKFKDDSKQEYFLDSTWQRTNVRKEVIKIKGKEDFIDEVAYTKFGPVVYDNTFGTVKSKKQLALKWTAHEGSNEFKAFYLMNQGKDYTDYLKALENYSCPSQNFVFACKNGDIAIKQQGRHPLTHTRIADGTQSSSDWKYYIPSDSNPKMLNPIRGFVSSANQFPVDENYPFPITHVGIYENFRAMRINHVLESGEELEVHDMQNLQSDNFNTYASMLLPTLLNRIRVATNLKTDEIAVLDKLEDWNFLNDKNSVEAVYFEEWSKQFTELLWDEMQEPDLPMKMPNAYRTAEFVASDSSSVFYDNLQTGEKETRDMLIRKSFDLAMHDLKNKYGTLEKVSDWGTHKATMVHHLSPTLDAFSHLSVYCGGNKGIVNATSKTHGPSWRMVVDFEGMKGYCVIPGGQSGNPGSLYYDNMIDQWANGKYHTTNFIKEEKLLADKKMFTLKFKHP